MNEKNLVIVESPAKAKTIEKYLGKDFKVVSSMGHVRDLPKDNTAIDIEHDFNPKYEVTADKKDTVKKLKSLAKKVETVWLATDADREGEAISWHLKTALNLDDNNTKRIVFREITKKAIQEAIKNPRSIDIDLVFAQQARRILDRLVGFELSPVLWKKISTGLSAGRVQSAAVRLVVEREREIENFDIKSSYKIIGEFDFGNGILLKAHRPKNLANLDEAKGFLERCKNAEFTIANLEKKIEKKNPSAPFTTSTLQQEASRKLGFSVAQTMLVAQKLYEAGHISYMRTDSTNLADEAIAKAAEQIKESFGERYLRTKRYETKAKNTQEAHEAIRPTDFSVTNVKMGRNEQRLYNLIWKRAIASQMAPAEIEKTTATIDISTLPDEKMVASADVFKFDGFMKVYNGNGNGNGNGMNEEDEENGNDTAILTKLSIGQKLRVIDIKAIEKFTNAPPRYTEASLVKKLEELGIGRPSTYAPTISTIQKRGYIIKESRPGKEREFTELVLKDNEITETRAKQTYNTEKNKLFPTNTAMVVNDFLVKHFQDVVDYSFTATVEKEFDDIAAGKKVWHDVLKEFYSEFHENVTKTDDLPRATKDIARELGIDPASGEPIYVKLGKYGAFAQIGDGAENKKPRFAPLKKGQYIENITFEEALDLFKLPRVIGEYEGEPMTVRIGRFGPFIAHKDKFYSLGKDNDPYTIEKEKGIEIIDAKRKRDAEKTIKLFDENPKVKILKGRWGPYIAVGRKFYKIPKDVEPASLSLDDCLKLIEEQDKEKEMKSEGKATKKTATKKKKTTTKKKKAE
jgi:DNA topoisomerase-1